MNGDLANAYEMLIKEFPPPPHPMENSTQPYPHLITTSCCWINLFNFSSDCVTSRSVGVVFLYIAATASASLILSDAKDCNIYIRTM